MYTYRLFKFCKWIRCTILIKLKAIRTTDESENQGRKYNISWREESQINYWETLKRATSMLYLKYLAIFLEKVHTDTIIEDTRHRVRWWEHRRLELSTNTWLHKTGFWSSSVEHHHQHILSTDTQTQPLSQNIQIKDCMLTERWKFCSFFFKHII